MSPHDHYSLSAQAWAVVAFLSVIFGLMLAVQWDKAKAWWRENTRDSWSMNERNTRLR